MTINFDLFDAAIEDAVKGANGYQHDQSDWAQPADPYATSETACGTAMCLAGFASMRAGAEVPTPFYSNISRGWYMPIWRVDPQTGQLDSDGQHVSDFARIRLGLTMFQADALFGSGNTIGDIRRMRDVLRENPNADWNELEPDESGDASNDESDRCPCGCNDIYY